MSTLFICGANTRRSLPVISRVLDAHMPDAGLAIIPNTSHAMFAKDPLRFCLPAFLQGRDPEIAALR